MLINVLCIKALYDVIIIVFIKKNKKKDKYHVWNVIYIESVWYNIDVTFDLDLSIHDYRYDYFNLCDIELNDRKSLFNVHKCNKYFDYYKRINRYAGDSRELVNIIKNNNDQIITIQLPIIKEDREEIIKYLMKIVFKNSKKDRKIEVRINPNFDRGCIYDSDRLIFYSI